MLVKVIFSALLLMAIGGCAIVAPSSTIQLGPLKQISLPIKEALERQTRLPAAMSANALVQFTLKGKAQPRVTGIINWERAENGLKLRATGLGAMGVTVFDCLLTDDWLYLYIPSHGVIYTADLGDEALLPDGRMLNGIADEAMLVLAPWSAYGMGGDKDVSECPAGQWEGSSVRPLCIGFVEDGRRGVVGLDPKTLAPLYLRLEGLDVRYSAPDGLPDGSPYPTGFHLEMAGLGLKIDVDLKKILPRRPDVSLFDPAPFCQGRILPLSVLIDRIKNS
ncbi:MAG: hypothetical protein ACP5J5_07695 [Dissulfurimicrobium sp.]|uniref:hypothetical protein n=1 Tax=Dissulfurimicrobium TaxID=1769732 RepID=UPI001ED9CED7|nr:hypothetical protein [Dissulfurimicrobium hydrothermale]UKL13618.1 hypothetical protein LGS26_09150 [Dissulfurimicrobium hydrothermale]